MNEKRLGEKIFLLSVSMLFAVILTFGLPKNVLLLSFYIVPIILAANYYGLAGGIGCASISAALAVGLAIHSGVLLDNAQVIAQIILYFLVGGFGGFMQRENMRIQRALHLSSITDELTGLYNYQHFRTRLDEEVRRAKRYRHPLALIMCDINRFKQYNDVFGHPSGNFVLNKMGALIKDSIRESDIPFRYGGDEFAVILPETGADAEKVAERIVKIVNSAFHSGDIEDSLKPSLTAGVVVADPEHPLTTSQLLLLVDSALYKAKKTNGNILLLRPEE